MAWLTGYPRDKIVWNPTIEKDKCVKCGMCMNCGRNVFTWTDDGPTVTQPNQCIVGCTTCRSLCEGNAIRFPALRELRDLYKREGIWEKVKQQLIADGKITLIKKRGGLA